MQRYTEGDLQAKHILIERNLRLVAHIIKKYQSLDEDPDDLISIGTIGLIKAIVTFNADKGNRLAAYASKCIDNEILMYLRAKKKTTREISLYEPIGTDREGNEIQLYDIIEAEDEDVSEKIHLKENIQKLYENNKPAFPEGKTRSKNAIWSLSWRRIYTAGDCLTTRHLPLLCLSY